MYNNTCVLVYHINHIKYINQFSSVQFTLQSIHNIHLLSCECQVIVTVCTCFFFKIMSHTGVMDYNETCCMHLPPGVVHNFPKAVGV